MPGTNWNGTITSLDTATYAVRRAGWRECTSVPRDVTRPRAPPRIARIPDRRLPEEEGGEEKIMARPAEEPPSAIGEGRVGCTIRMRRRSIGATMGRCAFWRWGRRGSSSRGRDSITTIRATVNVGRSSTRNKLTISTTEQEEEEEGDAPTTSTARCPEYARPRAGANAIRGRRDRTAPISISRRWIRRAWAIWTRITRRGADR
mmetsp:Transcript_17619/g.42413  ORF Transcript_17619/g.42413 Transcript_17619/m.42413 type:complete len:204 (+) Transcript_17619:746-1357(+)